MTRIQIQRSAEWLHAAPTLDGPPRLHAEAQALLSIGYFGGAYAILNPHRKEFEGVPDVAMVFARIAVNAGDTLAARDTLARFMPPNEVDRRIEDWLRERDLVAP